jgi:hypothetical protein
MTMEARLESDLKPLATIELGSLRAKIVEDPQGRQCAAIVIGNNEILFTVTQLLMLRELFTASLKALTNCRPHTDGGSS